MVDPIDILSYIICTKADFDVFCSDTKDVNVTKLNVLQQVVLYKRVKRNIKNKSTFWTCISYSEEIGKELNFPWFMKWYA